MPRIHLPGRPYRFLIGIVVLAIVTAGAIAIFAQRAKDDREAAAQAKRAEQARMVEVRKYELDMMRQTAHNRPDGADAIIMAELTGSRFARLEWIVTDVFLPLVSDPKREALGYQALHAVNRTTPQIQEALNQWVDKMPGSHAARLLRGLNRLSFAAINMPTPQDGDEVATKKRDMDRYLRLSAEDLDEALRLNPKLVPAILGKMQLATLKADKDAIAPLYESAQKLAPLSPQVQMDYLWTVSPQFGGSIEKMEEAIAKVRPLYAENPNLKVIEGRPLVERGNAAMTGKDATKAMALYQEALTHGEDPMYHMQLGGTYAATMQADRALKEYESVTKRAPASFKAFFMLALCYSEQNNNLMAVSQLDQALERNPYATFIYAVRGSLHYKEGELNEALEDFKKAAELAPGNRVYRESVEKIKQALKM